MADHEQYAHVLLFACPRCGLPLAATAINARKNPEIAEAKRFNLPCQCGWTGEIAGVTAVKHWVEPWSRGNPIEPGEPGSPEKTAAERET